MVPNRLCSVESVFFKGRAEKKREIEAESREPRAESQHETGLKADNHTGIARAAAIARDNKGGEGRGPGGGLLV